MAAALLGFALTPAAAFGHAAFLDSEPAPAERLEASPRQISIEFSEPLIAKLTRASLIAVGTGDRVPASVAMTAERRLVVRPRVQLARGAYRIDWHTVSPKDGHALEGSMGFGVRTAAAGGQSLVQSPLERGGWLRVVFRALFYAGLIFFAGGVLNAALLAPRSGVSGWLLPAADPEAEDRLTARTLDAGWLAVSAGIATLVADALKAGGASPRTLDEFLFSSMAGVERLATILAVLAAVLLCGRRPRAAAAALVASLAGVALAGHANSAEARTAALLSDWVHLVAGGIWLGGVAQIAFAWWRPPIARDGRSPVIRDVLPSFGRVALPAFLVVVTTGFVNALLELGAPADLWATAYGRVLAVKIGLVGLVAAASYVHALRLRPRLLRADATGERLERRHWGLIRAEPIPGALAVAAAALLVAFPLPPRQLGATQDAQADRASACDPCPQRPAAPDELAVAEQAGTDIVATWVRGTPGGMVGEVRVLDRRGRPSPVAARVAAVEQQACGRGCWAIRTRRRLDTLVVDVAGGGRTFRARLPIRWDAAANRRATRVLVAAERTMRRLRSVRQIETVTSGPGTFARTSYRLQAPDRMAFVTDRGVRTVIIGDRDWFRTAGTPWERSPERRPAPFRTRTWFRWTPFSDTARLLRERTEDGRRVAELALFDSGTPAWYRLTIDRATRRVLRARMIAGGHFMSQRFAAFDAPVRIRPPR